MTGSAAPATPSRDERLRKGFVVPVARSPVARKRETLAVRRRRESRFEESATQERLVAMLGKLLDPAVARCFALENRPRSAWAGARQKRLGVRAGMPDLMFLMKGKPPLWIELKSKRGVPSREQWQVFAELREKGSDVYVARTARAALMALHLAGVPLRPPWKPQPLAEWEGPFLITDPHQRLPQHPEVAMQRKAEQRRWREKQRERKAQQRQWRERAEARKAARDFICLEPEQSPDSDGPAME